jgi:hypothetical protein
MFTTYFFRQISLYRVVKKLVCGAGLLDNVKSDSVKRFNNLNQARK